MILFLGRGYSGERSVFQWRMGLKNMLILRCLEDSQVKMSYGQFGIESTNGVM